MTRRSGPAGRAAALALVCGALTAGCLTPAGVGPPPERPTEGDAAVFSHDDWDGFLARHVDDEGRVDYAAAGQDRDDLDRYLRALAEVSPDSAPERFPEEADRLAYWINAYNATVIDRVLAHHPIASVQDVRAPWLFRWLPAGAGFFVFERFSLGGRKTQLYALENGLIRKRFAEPRIHFALNCASTSCPRLPAEAFRGDRLEAQLAREAMRFLAEPRNVEIDRLAGEVRLSSIFEWYRGDFRTPGAGRGDAILIAYLRDALPPERVADLDACRGCRVRFVPYDWSLNAQR